MTPRASWHDPGRRSAGDRPARPPPAYPGRGGSRLLPAPSSVARRFRLGSGARGRRRRPRHDPGERPRVSPRRSGSYNLAWKLQLMLEGRRLLPDRASPGDPGNGEGVGRGPRRKCAQQRGSRRSGPCPSRQSRHSAQVLAAVEAGHELGVAYGDGPIVAGRVAGALGVLPGRRIRDAGPLMRGDGSTIFFASSCPRNSRCGSAPGIGDPSGPIALGERSAPAVRVPGLVIFDRPLPLTARRGGPGRSRATRARSTGRRGGAAYVVLRAA
jgi:hypothetical protein